MKTILLLIISLTVNTLHADDIKTETKYNDYEFTIVNTTNKKIDLESISEDSKYSLPLSVDPRWGSEKLDVKIKYQHIIERRILPEVGPLTDIRNNYSLPVFTFVNEDGYKCYVKTSGHLTTPKGEKETKIYDLKSVNMVVSDTYFSYYFDGSALTKEVILAIIKGKDVPDSVVKTDSNKVTLTVTQCHDGRNSELTVFNNSEEILSDISSNDSSLFNKNVEFLDNGKLSDYGSVNLQSNKSSLPEYFEFTFNNENQTYHVSYIRISSKNKGICSVSNSDWQCNITKTDLGEIINLTPSKNLKPILTINNQSNTEMSDISSQNLNLNGYSGEFLDNGQLAGNRSFYLSIDDLIHKKRFSIDFNSGGQKHRIYYSRNTLFGTGECSVDNFNHSDIWDEWMCSLNGSMSHLNLNLSVKKHRPSDHLSTNQSLKNGEHLMSPHLKYELRFQKEDGNLVLYGPSGVKWATNLYFHDDNATLRIQDDCNLVIYSGNGSALHSTGTSGTNCSLRLQDDGNLVIYDGKNRAIAATDSNTLNFN